METKNIKLGIKDKFSLSPLEVIFPCFEMEHFVLVILYIMCFEGEIYVYIMVQEDHLLRRYYIYLDSASLGWLPSSSNFCEWLQVLSHMTTA